MVAELISPGLHWECPPEVRVRASSPSLMVGDGISFFSCRAPSPVVSVSERSVIFPGSAIGCPCHWGQFWGRGALLLRLLGRGYSSMGPGNNVGQKHHHSGRVMNSDMALSCSLDPDVTMSLGGSTVGYGPSGSASLEYQHGLRQQPRLHCFG